MGNIPANVQSPARSGLATSIVIRERLEAQVTDSYLVREEKTSEC